MVVNGFVSVVISTIERRFDLTSTEMGFIASGYDIACVFCLVPVSYFGAVVHKPRWVGAGVFFLGLGSFLFAMPHLIAGPYDYEVGYDGNVCRPRVSVSNTGTNSSVWLSHESDTDPCDRHLSEDEARQQHGFSNYRHLFVLAHMLHGVGAAPIYTLAVTYLDENLKAKMTPLYVGMCICLKVL